MKIINVTKLAHIIASLHYGKGKVKMRKFIRTSSAAQVYNCDFDARFKMMEFHTNEDNNTDTDATAIGTAIHKVLEDSQGRRFPHEQDFMELLRKFEDPKLGYIRIFKCSNGQEYVLCAHPDDIQVGLDGYLSIMENKSTAIKDFEFVTRWKFPVAKFQTCIYAWIISDYLSRINDCLEAKLNDLHYRMNDTHGVNYYDSGTFQHMGSTLIVYYDEQRTEKDIDRALCLIDDVTKCIAPNPFKCRMCARVTKVKCTNPAKCESCARLPNKPDKCEGCIDYTGRTNTGV